MKTQKLITRYKDTRQKVIQAFCDKHGLQFQYWAGNGFTEKVAFNDLYYFDLKDIIGDLEVNAPKGDIIKWYLDNQKAIENNIPTIDYYSYAIFGLRVNELESES